MDFAYTEEQQAIVDLARQILTDRCTQERLREVEAGAEWFDRDLWADLARAELLGIALPEDVGGGGFGFLEACLVLAEVGRAVAPVPLVAVAPAALTLAAFGDDETRRRWLPGVVDGTVIVAPALAELDARPDDPHLRAERAGDGWALTGVKTAVPAAHVADALLVPARDGDGNRRLFVVATGTEGLVVERQDTFNHEPTFHVTFDGVVTVAELEARDGSDPVGWLVERATVALCAVASGVADACTRLTAEYVTGRKQFDRPIGSFQAVGHRMADCYIDDEAVLLSMLQAACRLADGVEAGKEVDVAKYWASWSGSRIGHAGLHLHGGISIDLDYPVHRYFLWAKQLEFTLGGGTPHLASLGQRLADEPVAVH